MGYELEAFCGRLEDLKTWEADVVALPQGMALAIGPSSNRGAELSRGIRLAWLSGEFFGGLGG